MSEFEQVGYDIEVRRRAGPVSRARSNPHYHNAFEIHYFSSGEGDFFVSDQTYTAGAGGLVFINTFEIHNRIVNDKVCEKTLLIYSPTFLESSPGFRVPDVFGILDAQLGGCRHITLPEGMRDDIDRLLKDMVRIYSERGPYASVYLRAYLAIFLTRIAEHLGGLLASGVRPRGTNDRLRGLIAYIKQNLDSELGLDMIARYFGTDKFYLCRYFRKHTGQSVMDYVSRMRIVNAEKLIVQGGHTITEISLMVGFGDMSSFDRAFKRYTGISAREYRRRITRTGR